MLDHSFSEAKQPSSRLRSVAQNLVGLDRKPAFSSLVQSAQEPWVPTWQEHSHIHQSEISSLLTPLPFHAEPLAPLRQSDEQALDDFFNDGQVEEILADVCRRLKELYPEPCWDDNPFDFLQGYL